MKIKDILIIAAISLVMFPMALFAVMYGTGFLKFSYGWANDKKEDKSSIEIVHYSAYQESLSVVHSKEFRALESQREDIENKRKRIDEDEKRLNDIKSELGRKNDDLAKTKARLEELVGISGELKDRRVKQLASIYESMRAEEAAPILYTMKNKFVVKILRKMGEPRQKAKLMAAMAKISKTRAGKISKMMTDLNIK